MAELLYSPLILSPPETEQTKPIEALISELDSNNDTQKLIALKQIIAAASLHKSNAATLTDAVIPVVKFCFSSNDKELKRLCLVFWELFWANKGEKSFSDATLLVWFNF